MKVPICPDVEGDFLGLANTTIARSEAMLVPVQVFSADQSPEATGLGHLCGDSIATHRPMLAGNFVRGGVNVYYFTPNPLLVGWGFEDPP